MDHAQPFARSFPWRTATLVAGAVALAELIGLLALAGVRLAPDVHSAAVRRAATVARTHAAPAPARTTAAKAWRHAAAASHAGPLRPRSRISVLVLNGNGVAHAAGNEAARLLALGYGHAIPADATSRGYARSLVLFAPGWQREAQRLGHDAGIRAVTPLDGLRPSQLRGSQLVVVLGDS